LPRIIAWLAAAGLVLSAAWHLGMLVGHDFLGQAGEVLFAGIFVVWFPTVLLLQKLGPAFRNTRDWRVLLEGTPHWVKPIVTATFANAIINFGLGVLGVYDLRGAGFWRMASGHAMVFYAAAWGVNLAAYRRDELGIDWKCQNGHEISPQAKFCELCGAPARRRRDRHSA
jgi:hypothetical protein